MSAPACLPTRMVEKVWGRDALPAPFATTGCGRIGEVWFEPQPPFENLLVKYLFTSEALSVQVHPCDQDMPAGQSGKDEAWLILGAEPGAKIAVGLTREMDTEAARIAALDGSIEELLDWRSVVPGDFYYLPAGTVHAIGAGISLLEIQQNVDLTYRFYDYGRPRALHLEDALRVASLNPYDPTNSCAGALGKSQQLVDGPRFRIDRVAGSVPADALDRYDGPVLVMPIAGNVSIAGQPAHHGECLAADRLADVDLAPDGVAVIAQSIG